MKWKLVRLSGDAQFSKLLFIGLSCSTVGMSLSDRSGRIPIDPRRCLGRQIEGIKVKGLRKSSSRLSLWEKGRFEDQSLISLKLGVDSNGMVNSAVLADSAFQPQTLEEVSSLSIEFLKKHRIWSPDAELVLDRHRDHILVRDLPNVHPMVPVVITSGPEGIALTFGKP